MQILLSVQVLCYPAYLLSYCPVSISFYAIFFSGAICFFASVVAPVYSYTSFLLAAVAPVPVLI